jgi:hypothetical protein
MNDITYTASIELEVTAPASYTPSRVGAILDHHIWDLNETTLSDVSVREALVTTNLVTRPAPDAPAPTVRSFTVSMSVVAPADMTDADVAGVIDLTDWAAGTQIGQGVVIDDVYHIADHVPCVVNNERALYMDGLDLIEPRAIPRAYKRAAEDWINHCHEQDGVLKLAQLLYLLDARMITGFTPEELEEIERLEFEENNRLVLRNGGAQ